MRSLSAVVGVLLPLALASPLRASLGRRDEDNTASVNLGFSRGTPQHWASGFIYGIPDAEDQIPDHFYTDMGFNYGRTGGAQMPEPSRGWIWGHDEYLGRLESTLSNIRTCRKYGAEVIILPHDLWGTDNSNETTVWPGDNGDWTDYDNFIKTLMADLADNDALEGLVWDIWNEPDIDIFWKRPQQQWIDLYIRTHKLIREDPTYDSVIISGPSMAYRPFSDNTWWTDWLAQIASNDTVPDQYSYHLLGETGAFDNDIQNTNVSLAEMLDTYGLPERQININEYAAPEEQIPAGAAYWISRLERFDAIGLRANWLGGTTLHDLMANLLTKEADPYDYEATDYIPVGEYHVYTYYNLNMTGTRVETVGSGDALFDVYATAGEDKVRVLAGSWHTAGQWYITINQLSEVGLPSNGTLDIQTWEFTGSSVWEPVEGASDRGVEEYEYSDDSVTIMVDQVQNTTAWAFEFNVA